MMETTETTEIVHTEVISPEVIYQQDKATIDTQIATAKNYPRNPMKALQQCVAIVSGDLATAQVCHYSVPRGGKQISGPSVHMAKIVAQQWKNLRIQARVINIDRTHVTSQATCFDLENNIAIQVEVKRSIMTKTGRMSDDMITVTGNAANSIALRNAIYSIIPRDVIDKIYNAAKKMIAGDVSDENKLAAKRKQVFDKLMGQFNVTEAEILSAIGKASINYITADDIVNLIGIGTAIADGDTSVDEAFRKKKNGEKEKFGDDFLSKKEEPPVAKKDEPKVTDEIRKKVMGIKDAERFIEYTNNLTHLHALPEFKALVLEKLDSFPADKRDDIASKLK